MNKYNAVGLKTEDGFFHSKAEFARWRELKLLEKQGNIKRLRRQVKYPLHSRGGTKIGSLVIDFDYFEGRVHVLEDKKGFMTALAKWKLRHLQGEYKRHVVRVT